MKKTRKLLPAIAMLLMSAVMMTTASFAWFSINKTVDVTGMNVTAKAEGSLVINKEFSTGTLANTRTVGLEPYTTGLNPITFMEGTYKYCSNGQDVDPLTGLAAQDKNLSFTEVSSNVESYYVDYVIYLSAEGVPIEDVVLKATVTFAGTPTLNQQAATVAFTVGTTAVSVNQPDYEVATAPTSVNGVVAKATATATTTEVDLSDNTFDIPLYKTTAETPTYSAIPVLMRVYFDGALTEDSGTKTYVRSEAISTQALGITVQFSIA